MVLRTSSDIGGQYVVDTNSIYAKMLREAIIRRAYPVQNILQIHEKTYEFQRRIDTYKTAYTADGNAFPPNKSQFESETRNVNVVSTGFSYTANELARINSTADPFSTKLSRVSATIGRDEDILAIAGSGKSGSYNMQGVSHSSNAETASTDLDLTSFDTLRTSLNEIINELNTNAQDLSTGAFTQSNPIVIMMTQDIENRLETLTGSLSDNTVGADIFNQIINRRIPNASIFTTDLLGATVTSIDDIPSVDTNGSTNFLMYSYNVNHRKLVTSPFKTTQKSEHDDLEYRISERFGTSTIEKSSAIYSGSVELDSEA